eukprot:c10133_g1_i2.p1 GENE.c10133_g1_i2~~c10133_g1_i2.p1  ORF type:complete len:434 (-),score=74.54 c10133_g1_i2:238-1455(-)
MKFFAHCKLKRSNSPTEESQWVKEESFRVLHGNHRPSHSPAVGDGLGVVIDNDSSQHQQQDDVIPYTPDPLVTPICIAPMQGVTDTHWRNMFRLLTKKTKIYGPMISDDTILHSTNRDFFASTENEGPVAFQIAGMDPETMGEAAYLVEAQQSFCEINIAMGSQGKGAELIAAPEQARQAIYNVNRRVTHTPVSVKCRVGSEGSYDYEKLHEFVHQVRLAGTRHIIVHARSIFIHGLIGKSVPPLDYDMVHRLVADFPEMTICLNGGVKTLPEAHAHLHTPLVGIEPEFKNPVHSVMYGRAAWHDPWMFRHTDSQFFKSNDPGFTRREIVEKYLDYVDSLPEPHPVFKVLMRPLEHLFAGTSSEFNVLQTAAAEKGSDLSASEFVRSSISSIPSDVLDEPHSVVC